MDFSFHDERDWFLEKRFGLFIHWGIYALGKYHEQEQWRLNIPAEKYEKYAKEFNPVKFDPAQWLDLCQECGMDYMVFTAKHHDGFCMWNTRETSYNIMNTPYGKDVCAMLANECHKRDFPLEFYYSCVDWHHKAYPNLGRHHEIETDPAHHNFEAYMRFLKKQIAELCSNYGKLHGIWWDMNVPEAVDLSVHELIRSLQSAAIVNNRGYSPGDYSTPERQYHDDITPFGKPVEACESLYMHSWGYRENGALYSTRNLERKIALYTALGGNFLLNAGPAPDGTIDPGSVAKLKTIGSWYKKVKEALRAAPCPMAFCNGGSAGPKGSVVCTGGGKELNLILLNSPSGSDLRLEGIDVLPEEVTLLNNGQKLSATLEPVPYSLLLPPALRITDIPVDEMENEVMVIKLKFSKDIIKPQITCTAEEKSGILVKE